MFCLLFPQISIVLLACFYDWVSRKQDGDQHSGMVILSNVRIGALLGCDSFLQEVIVDLSHLHFAQLEVIIRILHYLFTYQCIFQCVI